MEKEKPKIKYVSFLDCKNGDILELIGDEGTKMFVLYNILREEVQIVEKYEFDGTIYLPPQDDLVDRGTVLLSSYPEGYGEIGKLIEHIEKYIYKYLDVTDTFRKLATYYVLLSWVYDCFEVLPYLRSLGDYGTGKTRLQKVIGSICYKPMFAGGATTPSPIFRIINLYKGTLVLDEADFRFSDSDSEIIKIFNCGYTQGIPVLRTEGDKDRMPVSYDVFGPKILGTRKRFDDAALESRCLTEIMTGNPRKDIPIHLPKDFNQETLRIRNMLLMFRLKSYGQLEVDPSLVIPNVEARVNQIILPILSIVKEDSVRQEIREFVTGYAEQLKSNRGDELPAEILRVMVEMVSGGETLRYKEIAKKLNEGRDKDQGEYIISPAKIGKINSSVFNLKTRQINGVTEILWDKDKVQRLCERYGIESEPRIQVDNVDDVDLLEKAKEIFQVDEFESKEQKEEAVESLQGLQTLPTQLDFEGKMS